MDRKMKDKYFILKDDAGEMKCCRALKHAGEEPLKDYFVYKQIVAFLLVVACFTIIIPC